MATAQSVAAAFRGGATTQGSATNPDLMALKTKQHAAWWSGDDAICGTALQIVGEERSEALDVRPDRKVLEVAAGNGNATSAATRRWCDVVSTNDAESLLALGRLRTLGKYPPRALNQTSEHPSMISRC
jgi:hypothetical protein